MNGNEHDALTRSSESPTVEKLRKQLEEAKDIIIILAEQHVMKHDGKFRGPYSTRINAVLGL